ncbi:MAG: penicillin-binding protein 2 [Rickettsiaceae bacterium H1]|nr:penicillin-binding protein 2 [Rickettsiaceae bacterium H1]
MFINSRKQINVRVLILQAFFIITSFIIIIRLITICTSQSIQEHIKCQENFHKRPDIIDRNGVKLAVDLETVSLYAHPNKISNQKKVAEKLHEIFNDISYEKMNDKLSPFHPFVWIKRHITPNEQSAVNNLGIPNLKFYPDQKRVYIFGNIFAHILGYVDTDGRGISGLERYIDANKIAEKEIILSLDNRIQNVLNEELEKAVSHYQALGGAGVILDANNAEIIALVSLPNFDPHKLSKLTDNQKFNRATLGVYEFGSILKLFTVAAALDTNITNVEEEYDVSQPLKIGKHMIKDFHSHPTPKLSVKKVFTRSSNIGMAKIGMKLGPDLQKEYFRNMGLISPLIVEVTEKSNTIVPKLWNNAITASISYGYGISPTLLHVAQGTASLVNGGKFYPATVFPGKNNKPIQVIKEETSETIRMLMQAVVKDGTGRRANAKGYNVGGKTGSGEKNIKGVYKKNANVSSFIAAFPIESPKYVIVIMLDEPKPADGNKFVTGGIVAAPIIKKIVNRISPILNILPE